MTNDMKTIDEIPLRRGHWRVLVVASMGQMLGGGLATLVGIVLPMLQLTLHPELRSWQQGLMACSSLTGITVGSLLFGRLSDRHGYLLYFRLCPLLVFVAAMTAWVGASLPWLAGGLFFMGLGIGGGYSLDSDYISEIMPVRWRVFMVGVAKAFSALGNIAMAVVCFLLLRHGMTPAMWPSLLLTVAAFALLMVLLRLHFAQSPGWLAAHGRMEEADKAVRYFLGDDVRMTHVATRSSPQGEKPDAPAGSGPATVSPSTGTTQPAQEGLFKGKNLQRVIFSGVPWACEGLGVYGIGVFLPVLLMALGLEGTGGDSVAGEMHHLVRSIELTAWINGFVLVGFLAGLAVVRRCNHVYQSAAGFLLCAMGMALLLAAYEYRLPDWVAIAGLMLFELFLNGGPHLLTFILPSEIYPVTDRGEGAGVAAAMGKIGAVLGVLFIPMLLEWGGMRLVLVVCIAAQLLGALVTLVWGRKVI